MDTQIQPKDDAKVQLEQEMQALVKESEVAAHSPEGVDQYGPLPGTPEFEQVTALTTARSLDLPPKDPELELLIAKQKLEEEVQALVKESNENISDDAELAMPMPPGAYNTEEWERLSKERRELYFRVPLTFSRLQSEQARWSRYNFGHLKSDYNAPFKGIAEEFGELSHSLLKQEQGIRGTFEEHEKNAKDAIGDMLVFMADFCTRKGWDMQEIIDTTWAEVSKRDWKKFPKNGLTE